MPHHQELPVIVENEIMQEIKRIAGVAELDEERARKELRQQRPIARRRVDESGDEDGAALGADDAERISRGAEDRHHQSEENAEAAIGQYPAGRSAFAFAGARQKNLRGDRAQQEFGDAAVGRLKQDPVGQFVGLDLGIMRGRPSAPCVGMDQAKI